VLRRTMDVQPPPAAGDHVDRVASAATAEPVVPRQRGAPFPRDCGYTLNEFSEQLARDVCRFTTGATVGYSAVPGGHENRFIELSEPMTRHADQADTLTCETSLSYGFGLRCACRQRLARCTHGSRPPALRQDSILVWPANQRLFPPSIDHRSNTIRP